MNWNRIEQEWDQLKSKVRERWGRLTDDDIDSIRGDRGRLERKISDVYGKTPEEARKDVAAFTDTCGCE